MLALVSCIIQSNRLLLLRYVSPAPTAAPIAEIAPIAPSAAPIDPSAAPFDPSVAPIAPTKREIRFRGLKLD